MQIGRRAALKLFALVGVSLAGIGALWRKLAVAQSPGLALRKIGTGDAADLQAIMNSCVADADSFHGRCDGWSQSWADHMVRRRKESVILTVDGIPSRLLRAGANRESSAPPPLRMQARRSGRNTI